MEKKETLKDPWEEVEQLQKKHEAAVKAFIGSAKEQADDVFKLMLEITFERLKTLEERMVAGRIMIAPRVESEE